MRRSCPHLRRQLACEVNREKTGIHANSAALFADRRDDVIWALARPSAIVVGSEAASSLCTWRS
jgi:hypothetical protein